MTKSFIQILVILLVVVVAGVIFLIVSTLTNDKIPAPTQKQIQELDPNLNTQLFDVLKKAPSN